MDRLLQDLVEIAFTEELFVFRRNDPGSGNIEIGKRKDALQQRFVGKDRDRFGHPARFEAIDRERLLQSSPLVPSAELGQETVPHAFPDLEQLRDHDAVVRGNEVNDMKIVHSQIEQGLIVFIKRFEVVPDDLHPVQQVAPVNFENTGNVDFIGRQEINEVVDMLQVPAAGQIVQFRLDDPKQAAVVLQIRQLMQDRLIERMQIIRDLLRIGFQLLFQAFLQGLHLLPFCLQLIDGRIQGCCHVAQGQLDIQQFLFLLDLMLNDGRLGIRLIPGFGIFQLEFSETLRRVVPLTVLQFVPERKKGIVGVFVIRNAGCILPVLFFITLEALGFRHSGQDAFRRAVIVLPQVVVDHVDHGFRLRRHHVVQPEKARDQEQRTEQDQYFFPELRPRMNDILVEEGVIETGNGNPVQVHQHAFLTFQSFPVHECAVGTPHVPQPGLAVFRDPDFRVMPGYDVGFQDQVVVLRGTDPERTFLQPDHFAVPFAAVGFQPMHVAGRVSCFRGLFDKDLGIADGGPAIFLQDGRGNFFPVIRDTVLFAGGQFHAVLDDVKFCVMVSAGTVVLRDDQVVVFRPSDGQGSVRIVQQESLDHFAAAADFKGIADAPFPGFLLIVRRFVRLFF